jgi:hypothetical protein
VVAAEHEEVLGIFDLVCEEQADGLEGLLATVYVVAEEEVVGLGGETAILEQAQQVVVLAVDVTTDLAGQSQHWLDVEIRLCRRIAGSLRTLIGASSSSRMGCEMKISRALVHRKRISVSSSWTCLPGLLPLTSRSLSMIESRSTSVSAIAGTGRWLRCRTGSKGEPRGWSKRDARRSVDGVPLAAR